MSQSNSEVQYYETDFTIGLTATDQRPDKKKLETDPEYRARCEAFQKILERDLKVYPHED